MSKPKRWTVSTQKEVAEFFGVQPDTVKHWRQAGMPGRRGVYDLKEIFGWWKERVLRKKTTAAESKDKGDKSLRRLRRNRAKLVELQFRRQNAELIEREEVHEGFAMLAAQLRAAGEILQRQFGAEAHAIIEEALDEARRELSARFGDADDSSN